MNVAFAVLVLLGFCALPGDSREGAAVKQYAAPGGKWTLSLPASWFTRPAGEEKAILSLDVTVREGTRAGYGRISLFPLEGMVRAEAQPYAEKAVQAARYRAEDPHIGLAPLPHLEFRYEKGGRRFTALMVYRMIRGRGVSFSAVFDRAVYPALRSRLFEAAASVKTALDPPRRIPEGWRVRRKGDFVYGIHPDYTGNPGAFHLFLVEEEKRFVKVHGSFTPNPDLPPVVLLHPPGGGPSRGTGVGETGFDPKGIRLLAHGVPPKRSMERALLAREAARFFHILRYGNLQPVWLSLGEGEIALERARTGRDLPWVSRDRLEALRSTRVLPFHRLVAGGPDRDDLTAFTNLAFLYCTLFHRGSRNTRKAFQECRKAFFETGDWDRAVEEHLFALDAAVLQEEAERMARSGLRPVRGS